MAKKKIILVLVFVSAFLYPSFVKAIEKENKIEVVKTQDEKDSKSIIKQAPKRNEFFFGYVNLAGTVLVSEKDRKLNKAIFADVFTKKRVTYIEGSLLPYGIKLKKVEKNKVVLEKKGREKILTLGDRNNYFREIKALKRSGYRQIAPNEWVVNSHYLFKNSEDLIKSVVESGLALKRLSKNPGIEISKNADNKMAGLGFKKGDRLIDINGTSLNGLKGLASAYEKMQQSENVTIKVLRNGKPVELNYWVARRGSPRYNMRQVLASEKIKKLLSM
jgi:type II secretory pathway component PulC